MFRVALNRFNPVSSSDMRCLPLILILLPSLVHTSTQERHQLNHSDEFVKQSVTVLSVSAREFINAFNEASDRVRLVLVFSPTCRHCLQGASQVQEILQEHPDAKIKILVLWSPILKGDSESKVIDATVYLSDGRAEHFWDLWSFGVRLYTKQLRYPKGDIAWDIFVVYKPFLAWTKTTPDPTLWMQDRNLEHGLKYDRQRLEAALEKWIQ